jgi:hypothetical protein
MAANILGTGSNPAFRTRVLPGGVAAMGQHMVVGQYLDHGWVQLAAQGYPGWHSGGSYGWLVYPRTVSKPLLSSICARMCKRMGSIYRIILGGTASSKHVQRGTALPDGHAFDLTKHKQCVWKSLGERQGCFRLSRSFKASHRPPPLQNPIALQTL